VKKEKIDGKKNRKKKIKWGSGGECKNIFKNKKKWREGKNQGEKKEKGEEKTNLLTTKPK